MRHTATVLLIFATASILPAQDGCTLYTCSTFPGEAFPKGPVPATSVSIGNPTGLTVDAAGNLYIAGPSIVFKVDAAGMITRIAGNGHNGFSGDGGPATEALLGFPRAIPNDPIDFGDVTGSLAIDAGGNLFIADFFNNRIRKVTNDGLISTVAGIADAQGNLPFIWPEGVAVDPTGTLYVTNSYGGLLRISPNQGILPLIGNNCGHAGSAGVCAPAGVAVDFRGDVYVADGNCRILRRGLDGTVSTVAGPLTLGGAFGPFLFMCGYTGDGGAATSANLGWPSGVTLDNSGNLYIADTANNRIRKVTSDGIITTVAGLGQKYQYPPTSAYSGDGGPATAAQISVPHAVAVDNAGNLYIADTENFVVRKVTPDGIISTVAGNGVFCCGVGGSISASPNPCALSGILCTAYVTWATTGISSAQVWVKVDNGSELLYDAALSCSDGNCAAPWIEGNGAVYTFTLYNCDGKSCTNTDHGNASVVSFIQVTAQ